MIELLPEEKRRKETKKEEGEKEVAFVIKEEKKEQKEIEQPRKQIFKKEKMKKIDLFGFLKTIFRKKILTIKKPEEKIEPIVKEEGEISPEISLMPEKILITKKLIRQKITQLLIFVFLAIIITFSLYLLTDFLLNKRINETKLLREEINLIGEKNSQIQDLLKNIKSYEQRIFLAEKLFKTHPYWTNFLAFLEKYTLPEVYYKDFSVDPGGKITIPAVAKDPLSAMKQLIIFQSAEEVEEVKFSDFNFLIEKGEKGEKVKVRKEDEKPVSFLIQLILKDKVFYQ